MEEKNLTIQSTKSLTNKSKEPKEIAVKSKNTALVKSKLIPDTKKEQFSKKASSKKTTKKVATKKGTSKAADKVLKAELSEKESVKKVSTKKSAAKKETIKTAKTTKKVTTKSTAKKSSTSKEDDTKTTKKSSTKKVATKGTVKKSSASKKDDSKTTKNASTKKTATKSTVKKSSASKKDDSKTSKKASTKKVAAKSTAKKSSTSKVTTKKVTKSTTKKSTTSKKITKKAEITAHANEYFDLPYRYNETIVKLLAQTPKRIFVYWDISDKDRTKYMEQFGEYFFHQTVPFLRIKNETLNYTFDVEINDFANSWYININDDNCKYSIELYRKFRENISNADVKDIDTNLNEHIFIATSNQMDVPNGKTLSNQYPRTIMFKNIKSGETTYKELTTPINEFYKLFDIDETNDMLKTLSSSK